MMTLTTSGAMDFFSLGLGSLPAVAHASQAGPCFGRHGTVAGRNKGGRGRGPVERTGYAGFFKVGGERRAGGLLQDSVHPLVGELAALDGGEVGSRSLLVGPQ